MSKLTKYAVIPSIEKGIEFRHTVLNTPHVIGYHNEFQTENWLMKCEIIRNEWDNIDLVLTIGRPTLLSELTCIPNSCRSKLLDIRTPLQYSCVDFAYGLGSPSNFFGSLTVAEQQLDRSYLPPLPPMDMSLLIFTCWGETDPAGYVLWGTFANYPHKSDSFWFLRYCLDFNAIEIDARTYFKLVDLSDNVLESAIRTEWQHALAFIRSGSTDNLSQYTPYLELNPVAQKTKTSVTSLCRANRASYRKTAP